MSLRGRHRRHKPNRVSRASLSVTAGGAGMALPLIGAVSAHAAPADVWDKVARCESTNDWSVNTGNGFYGGLQFTQSTWQAYGGTAYATRADLASRDQQIAVAEKVLDGQGPGAWPNCSRPAGLSKASAGTATPPAATEATAPRQAHATRARSTPTSLPDGSPKNGVYLVRSGDSLSAIADQQRVTGGWPALYRKNRGTVGDDPDLIYPGQRLSLGSGATGAPAPQARPEPKTGQRPKAEQRPKTETKPKTETEPRATPEPKNESGSDTASKPKAKVTAKGTAEPKATPTPDSTSHSRGTVDAGATSEPRHTSGGGTSGPKPQTTSKAPTTPKAKPTPAKSTPHQPARKPPPKSTGHPPTGGGYIAPVSGVTPTTGYRSSGSSWSSGHHTGVDFPVSVGTSVKAVHGGKVVAAGWGGAYGYQVVIRHPDGRYSQYAHLSQVGVRTGQAVKTGQRIARSGSTGNVTGPHLHFEVRTGPNYGSDINPLTYLRAHGVGV